MQNLLSDNRKTYGNIQQNYSTNIKNKIKPLNKLEKYENTFGTTSTENLPTPTVLLD